MRPGPAHPAQAPAPPPYLSTGAGARAPPGHCAAPGRSPRRRRRPGSRGPQALASASPHAIRAGQESARSLGMGSHCGEERGGLGLTAGAAREGVGRGGYTAYLRGMGVYMLCPDLKDRSHHHPSVRVANTLHSLQLPLHHGPKKSIYLVPLHKQRHMAETARVQDPTALGRGAAPGDQISVP